MVQDTQGRKVCPECSGTNTELVHDPKRNPQQYLVCYDCEETFEVSPQA